MPRLSLKARADKIAHRVAHELSDAEESDLTPVGSAEEGSLSPAASARKRKASTAGTPKKRKVAASLDEPAEGEEVEHHEEKPKPKRARKPPAPVFDKEGTEVLKRKRGETYYDAEGAEISKRVRKPADPTYDEEGNEIVKPKRTRKPKPEPVYVIPDVQPLKTDYKGRLGYACLNTVLRNKKPAAEAIFCARTCRIATIKEKGMDYLKGIGLQNIKDCLKLIEWNEANNIRFMRLSSEMFPFASHTEYGFSLEYANAELKAVGDFAKKHGHRLTTHPGQYTQLGSPRKEVYENAVRDLTYHAEMLDRMGIDKDGVMIIHGGGVYGDKEAALARIRANFPKLPENVRNRVTFENDELCYNADDLLPLCEELKAPFTFDYHHDWINPSAQTPGEMMDRILATWNVRGGITPKQHLSEPRPGAVSVTERRAHSDRIARLPDALPPHVDLMLEAKDKEQAVLQLHRQYNLYQVEHSSLRPPNPNPTLATGGRKSHSPKKKGVTTEDGAAEGEAAEDGEGGEGEDVKPAKKRRATKTKLESDPANALAFDGEDVKPTITKTPPKPKRQPKRAAAKIVQPEPEDIEMVEMVENAMDGEATMPEPEEPDAARPKAKRGDGKRPKTEEGAEDVEPARRTPAKRRKTVKTEDADE